MRNGARVVMALAAAAAGPIPLACGAVTGGHGLAPEYPKFPRGLNDAALQRAVVARAQDPHAPADTHDCEFAGNTPQRGNRPLFQHWDAAERRGSPSAQEQPDGAPAARRADAVHDKTSRVRRGELCWFSTALLGDSRRTPQSDAEGERSGLPTLMRAAQILKSTPSSHSKYTRALTFENFCQASSHVLRGGSGRSGWGGIYGGSAPLYDRGLPAWSPAARDDSRRRRPGRRERGYFMSAVSAAGGFVVGAAKALAVPYAAFLVLLYTAQRSIIFQAPQTVADPTATGGTLVRLPACNALLLTAESKKAREKGKERLRESRQVYRQERKGVLGGRLNAPCVVAVYFKAQQDMPTLAYFHGNADQLGWGAAYIGKCLSEQYGIGFYGIEYPGYGLSGGLETREESIYLAAEQLLEHLHDPVHGLNVDRAQTMLLGQSIGCAVAVEMAARGYGQRMV